MSRIAVMRGGFCALAVLVLMVPLRAQADCPDDCDGDGVDAIAVGGTDCDDTDPERFPGNAEICDSAGHDEDCDLDTVGHLDRDGDGLVDDSCCNGSNCPEEDCDDLVRTVHPNAPEVCNSVDDDCDGLVDEDLLTSFYSDTDQDGFGVGAAVGLCPGNYVGLAGNDYDCDDDNRAIVPGAQICTGPSTVGICAPDGSFDPGSCDVREACIAQPNGTGVCGARPLGRP